ncbi:MAG TPA: PRC-barrel domain-containing protein [Thermomicrobiales bacterium]|nr:PRC-barrel domain-containing protein [Thermomicrobiales bacterium]
MRIIMGSEVLTSDGEKLGDVDGIVINAGNGRVQQLLVESGLLRRRRRIVGISAVQAAGGSPLRLDMTKATAEQLPTYIEFEATVESPQTPEMPMILPAAGVGGPVMAEPIQGAIDYTGSGPFIESAPIDPDPSEVISNLEENDVILGRDTRVVDLGGDDLGGLEQLEIDGDAAVTQIVVSEGILFSHDRTLPGSAITSYGDNRVYVKTAKSSAG